MTCEWRWWAKIVGPRRMNLVVKRYVFLALVGLGAEPEWALDRMGNLGVRHTASCR